MSFYNPSPKELFHHFIIFFFFFTNHVPSVAVADGAVKYSLNVLQGQNWSLQLESVRWRLGKIILCPIPVDLPAATKAR